MTRKIQRYGYVPDLMDMRDHAYVASGNPLPKSVDLRAKMPPVWDQGQLGSCTAFGISAIVAFLHGFVGSQLWLYYRERVMEHTTRTDSGAEIRDGLKVVANQGLPREAEWPYDIAKFKKAPPAKVTKAAAKECLITEYKRLASVADYLDCLASGFPFTIGISVYESFESDAVAKSGKVPMPAKSEQLLGGHCIAVVGYTDAQDWICRNSWGSGWGQSGYFTLPHAYLANANLADDAWMATKDAEGTT